MPERVPRCVLALGLAALVAAGAAAVLVAAGAPLAYALAAGGVGLLGLGGAVVARVVRDRTHQARTADLARANDRLQRVMDAIPDPFLVIDCDHKIVLANAVARAGAGGDPVARGLTCHQVSHHRDTPCTGAADSCPLPEVLASKRPVRVQHTHYDASGEAHVVDIVASPVLDGRGEVIEVIEACRDVTARVRAEEAARHENAKLSAMISRMEEGVVFADAADVVVEANDFFCRFVHQPREAILGRTLHDLHQGEVRDLIEERVARFRGDPASEPFVVQRSMGPAEVVLRMQPIYADGRYDGVLLNVIDVTAFVRARQEAEAARAELAERARELEETRVAALNMVDDLERARAAAEEANRKLEQLATTDELTGLWNRRHFLASLDRECRRATRSGAPLALAMLDLDHFKAVNDTHGHAVGDRVLAAVAALMRAEARTTDLVARYGGEEFMILMPDTPGASAAAAAERLRRAIEGHPIVAGDQTLRVTASLGTTAVEPGETPDAERLVRQVDEMLYAAKQAGRNCVRTHATAAAPTGP